METNFRRAKETTYEKKTLPNGKENPKYIDLLDEDPSIAGQKFAIMSFVSPETILKQREMYMFEQFVKQWDLKKCMDKFYEFLHFASFKYKLNTENLLKDYEEFVATEAIKLKESNIEEDFKVFLEQREEKLVEKFQEEHEFQTSVRSCKIRGVFPSEGEAKNYIKKLQDFDMNHDMHICPVGLWVQCDPNPYKTADIQFLEEELNQLHHEKKKSEDKAKAEFEERVREQKRKAIEENMKMAAKSGNKLTQNIDENGNLVGVMQTVDFDSREVATEEETKKHNDEVLANAIANAEQKEEEQKTEEYISE